MAWQYHPLLILFALGGLVSLVVAGYCWRYMQARGDSYIVASIGLLGFNNAIWSFAATLKTASIDLQLSLLFYKLEFLGFLPNTAVGIVLALAYVGKDRWLTRRTFALLRPRDTWTGQRSATQVGFGSDVHPEIPPKSTQTDAPDESNRDPEQE